MDGLLHTESHARRGKSFSDAFLRLHRGVGLRALTYWQHRQISRAIGDNVCARSRVQRASTSRVSAHLRISRDRGKLLAKGDIRVCPATDAEIALRRSSVRSRSAPPSPSRSEERR